MKIVCIVVFLLLALSFAAAVGFYRFSFYYPPAKRKEPYAISGDEGYSQDIAERLHEGARQMKSVPYEEVSIRAKDGCTLHARYFEFCPGRPLEIFFHGYHGTAAWDGYGCFRFCKAHRHNLLIVEMRAHGKSESNTITFGIKERYDCLLWAEYAAERFGPETAIILSGLSMGSATVMMASELPLPGNVKAIIADCGYTSPEAVMKNFAVKMHIPVTIGYFFARLGARIFGGFDLNESSAIEAVGHTSVPILFIHGDQDEVVPFSMCEELFQACSSVKRKVVVENSTHAVNAVTDYEKYEREVEDFLRHVQVES